MVQVSARVGSHKSVKGVGVDLLVGGSHGKCIMDDGACFRTSRVPDVCSGWLPAKSDNLVCRRDRSCRSDCKRDSGSCGFGVKPRVWTLFGMGDGLILMVLCGEGVRIFIKDLPRYSHKAYI